MLGGIILLGTPGGVWLTASMPLAVLLISERMAADSAWPMAIIMGLAWPLLIPPAYVTACNAQHPGRRRLWLAAGLTTAGVVLMGAGFQVWAGRPG